MRNQRGDAYAKRTEEFMLEYESRLGTTLVIIQSNSLMLSGWRTRVSERLIDVLVVRIVEVRSDVGRN